MPAQKLTRGRIVQICITLAVLVTAFTWRTIEHNNVKTVNCKVNQTCQFIYGSNEINFAIGADKLTLSTTNYVNLNITIEGQHTLVDKESIELEFVGESIILADSNLDHTLEVIVAR